VNARLVMGGLFLGIALWKTLAAIQKCRFVRNRRHPRGILEVAAQPQAENCLPKKTAGPFSRTATRVRAFCRYRAFFKVFLESRCLTRHRALQ